jgi:hypothetical protein
MDCECVPNVNLLAPYVLLTISIILTGADRPVTEAERSKMLTMIEAQCCSATSWNAMTTTTCLRWTTLLVVMPDMRSSAQPTQLKA